MASTARAHFLVERTIDGITVAGFADAELVDEVLIREVEDELWELANGVGPAPLLVSFRRVRLMSSRMLGVLLQFSRRFRQIGGRLKLCEINPDLREVFRITRYEKSFEIFPDELRALDAF